MKKSSLLIICLVLIISACGGNNGGEDVAVGSVPQIHVFPGEQEKRLISQETIEQNNCQGTAEMSQEVGRSHTVQYTLELGSGIKVEADGRAKIPEIGEVGIGAEIAANYQVGYGRSETVSRAQTVAAAPESHIQHTIQQFEVWDTGEVLVVVGEVTQRLPYSFRRDFSIDAVAPANIGCPGTSEEVPEDLPPTTEAPTPKPIPATPSFPQMFFSEDEIPPPPNTSMTITVNEGEIHAMTSGSICVAGVCLPGGTDRGSVVVLLPEKEYEITGLVSTWNWHGGFTGPPEQWEVLADELVRQQKIPGTCSDGDGCSTVDVLIVGPDGLISQYTE